MSYGKYSEVYFAVDLTSQVNIKIGEAVNARRRNRQLDTYEIVQTRQVIDNKPARLFIEGYLRLMIESTGKAYRPMDSRGREKIDYFVCDNATTANWIAKNFDNWVTLAENAAESIWNSGQEMGVDYKLSIPTGREYLFERVEETVKTCGRWFEKFQMTNDEQSKLIKELHDTFAPCGYSCTTSRNYSWAYFQVVKNVA